MEKTLVSIRFGQRGGFWNVSLSLNRGLKDRLTGHMTSVLTLGAALLVPLMGLALFLRARPILAISPVKELLLSTTWHPLEGAFGFYPFIVGTLWVTTVAMIIAVPPSLLTAVYLSEYAPSRVRALAKPLIDLLAGIPSVVYGVWGMLTVVPFVEKAVAPTLNRWLGFIPLFRADNPTGYGVLAGGLVLAVMVFPIIIAVAEEVIRAAPQGLREASLALGATRWQTVKHVVLRQTMPGVTAAVVLGFSRAFGETMAVLMVVGNVPRVPRSIFDPAYPLTALIANNYGEMLSIPSYDAALLGAALILLLVVLAFNTASRLVLVRLVRNESE
ncbi:MAG: phosphate ABC transporter permease subunit PstC [Anaerolineales bacterium]|nr:MAG: phosphate ABC transporter permease subunit PstC [Anaerolineales bacterium]